MKTAQTYQQTTRGRKALGFVLNTPFGEIGVTASNRKSLAAVYHLVTGRKLESFESIVISKG